MTDLISFRPIISSDMCFLNRLYATTREEELSAVEWGDAQKQAFLRQQFHAQHVYYQSQFPQAEFDVILSDSQPIGRRYVNRNDEEIHLIELSLLPEFRGRGIGSRILKDLKQEAQAGVRPLRLHAEIFSKALRLYERMGFRVLEEHGSHLLMEWSSSK